MTALLAFAAGLMWGASLTILWFWAAEPANTLDQHWRDAHDLFGDDE